MDWHAPVGIAAVLFGAFTLYKFRPIFDRGEKKTGRIPLRDARARLAKASTDAERTEALAAAGDACAHGVGLTGAACSYYLRAMRLAPKSAELVERAAAGLARRPRALETLLWRRLGAEPWTGDHRPATQAALRQLLVIYTKSHRSAMRARMVERALESLEPERASLRASS